MNILSFVYVRPIAMYTKIVIIIVQTGTST